MNTLVVVAHFDCEKRLRSHFIRSLEKYVEYARRVVVVSTSGILESEAEKLPTGVEFLERRNFGYDFFSLKWGLDYVGDWVDYDNVVLCNDSFVGPLVPLQRIVESTQMGDCDFMGMTLSRFPETHAQSFFTVASKPVLQSQGFQSFWSEMAPVSVRMDVIKKYEIGLTKSVLDSGFKVGSFFNPNDAQKTLAMHRYQWHLSHRYSVENPEKFMAQVRPDAMDPKIASVRWNPVTALADFVLGDNALPVLKFDTLRYDPYALGADYLLAAAEIEMPGEFEGVRDFINSTSDRYRIRKGEFNLMASRSETVSNGVAYCPQFEVHNVEALTRNS